MALDVGLRVWVARVVVLGLAAECRLTRLPFTERVQHGNRYSVSERLLPAVLAQPARRGVRGTLRLAYVL